MTTTDTANQSPAVKSMDDIVALCRRRGFIFQSSEIYGGINGFWDYGPLGAQLKKNLKDAWWQDVVQQELTGPDGRPVDIVPLDTTIIMNPEVWVASGHIGGFNDMTTDCRECKTRPRADHVMVLHMRPESVGKDLYFSGSGTLYDVRQQNMKKLKSLDESYLKFTNFLDLDETERACVPCPNCGVIGSLTEPRQFNLMFESHAGAVRSEDNKVYLRPETAQGIFVNFWNVVDTSRVKVPFGIAQMGKAFRNEVTPRNYTFRSREFEQMEIEFFIPDPEAVGEDVARTAEWYQFWRDERYRWWQSIGLAGDNLTLREHDQDELAHYAKEGAGTSDIEYRFPFTAPGYGELEGVSHRSNYDLRQHANHTGKADKLKYFDQDRNARYFPHVIEPSAGADRGTLALLCEAYTPDDSRPSKVFMKFHPRMAPIKAAVFPLVNKDGMPEKAEGLYRQLRKRWMVQFDVKQNIGKRYARMDEAGTPYCFTIDGDTMTDDTVTVRERDTQSQERINIDQVERYLADRIERG